MSRRPLSTAWSQHIKDKDEKTSFEDTVRHSTAALERLREITLKLQGELHTNSLKMDTFDNPNWPYKQAYHLGKQAGLGEILKLLSFLDPKEKS